VAKVCKYLLNQLTYSTKVCYRTTRFCKAQSKLIDTQIQFQIQKPKTESMVVLLVFYEFFKASPVKAK
jgi:hypothetical protein